MNKIYLVIILVLLCIIGYGFIKISGYDALYAKQQQIISKKELAYSGAIDKWIRINK